MLVLHVHQEYILAQLKVDSTSGIFDEDWFDLQDCTYDHEVSL